jgi:hypothetical protein
VIESKEDNTNAVFFACLHSANNLTGMGQETEPIRDVAEVLPLM